MNLDKTKRYLLACSYGPDSMALFYLLEKENYNFDIAHVNYGLRKEAQKETEDLQKYCEIHHKKLFVRIAEVNKSKNIENECRKIRYLFFKKLSEKYGYDAVLVAHHQDDLLETYLMQKERHNCPKFFGIAEKTTIFDVDIVRPLLNYTKRELQNLCDENGVPYAIDSSNLEDSYLRNQIRHHIVDNLSNYKRDKLLSELNSDNQKLDNIFNKLSHLDLQDVKTLLSLDELTYLYAINDSANQVQSNAEISKKQAMEIRKVLLSDKPNVSTKVKGDLYFNKEYDRAYFSLEDNESNGWSYKIDSRVVVNNEHFYLNLNSDTSNLNISDSSFPVVVRLANPKDIVVINDYKVEVRRLFIDWKMPLSIRKKWPVIVDKTGKVIYIPRYQKDFHNDGKRNFYVKL